MNFKQLKHAKNQQKNHLQVGRMLKGAVVLVKGVCAQFQLNINTALQRKKA